MNTIWIYAPCWMGTIFSGSISRYREDSAAAKPGQEVKSGRREGTKWSISLVSNSGFYFDTPMAISRSYSWVGYLTGL